MRKIGRCADSLNMPCWVVGGFVRDKLLQRPCTDLDIVCLGDGMELAKLAAGSFGDNPKVTLFKNFGTAHFHSNGWDIEFVGARKESYRSHSRKPSVSSGTLQDDQLRRDFTINALAMCINQNGFGEIVDPFGGLTDLQNNLLKTPADPSITFSDDPLRMMRAIRFASQLGFHIQAKVFEAIIAQKERIKIVAAERIADELNKIVLSPMPSRGFDLLYKSGLLEIIFPEMVALAGAEFVDGKGHKDNFYHTLQVLDNISAATENLWLRWAAILHDIAKPATKRFEQGHGWTFHGHEVVGGRMVPKIFARLKLPLTEPMRYVRKLVELHLRPISLTKENITDAAIRRLLFDAGEDYDDLMTLCKADITSKNPHKVKRYLSNFDMVEKRAAFIEESDKIRNWQPPVDGNEIMQRFGLPPGRQVGVLKNALKDAILDGIIPNSREASIAFLTELAASLPDVQERAGKG